MTRRDGRKCAEENMLTHPFLHFAACHVLMLILQARLFAMCLFVNDSFSFTRCVFFSSFIGYGLLFTAIQNLYLQTLIKGDLLFKQYKTKEK